MLEDENRQITITEAAELFGFSTSWMRILLERGRVPGRKFGQTWTVNKETLERYLKERPPRGRPRKANQ